MPRPTYEAGTYTEWWMFRLADPHWCIQIVLDLLSTLLQEEAFQQEGTATPADAVNYFTDAYLTLQHMPLQAGQTMFSFEATIKPGWLPCDGTTYLKADYPTLWANLDPVFGVDATHFRVPDMRRKFPLGDDGATNIGDTGGVENVTLTVPQIPAHTHTDAGHTHTDAGHTHTDAGHTHTDAGHTHTDVGHAHADVGHTHVTVTPSPSLGTIAAGAPAPSAVPVPGVTSIGFANISTGFANISTGFASIQTGHASIQTGHASIQSGQANNQNTGGGDSHTNMPPWVAGRWLIWTGV